MINRCVRLNLRSVIFMLFSFFLNGIKYSHTSSANNMDNQHQITKSDGQKNISNPPSGAPLTINKNEDEISGIYTTMCPINEECGKLEFPCIKCNYDPSCTYGKNMNITCEPLIACTGDKKITKNMNCRYCFLTDVWEHSCVQKGNCNSNEYYRTNCTVHSNVVCLGNRVFFKNTRCNWTNGAKWSTALLISVTLGGFGADRFYLGHWQEGIGKLFSFGGLGVWTLIDVILISLHYLGPADGSLYI